MKIKIKIEYGDDFCEKNKFFCIDDAIAHLTFLKNKTSAEPSHFRSWMHNGTTYYVGEQVLVSLRGSDGTWQSRTLERIVDSKTIVCAGPSVYGTSYSRTYMWKFIKKATAP